MALKYPLVNYSGKTKEIAATDKTYLGYNKWTAVFILDGGGAAITTGVKLDLQVPDAFTLNSVTMLADQSGSITVDIWKDTYANFPPTNADTICGGDKPSISSATKSEKTDLSAWTTSCAAGSILRLNVDSCSTITKCVIQLHGYKLS